MRQCAELYRELIKIHITPSQADDLELWQIASLMTEPASSIANNPKEMRRRLTAARHRAHAEGRELDPDEVFTGMSEAQVSGKVG